MEGKFWRSLSSLLWERGFLLSLITLRLTFFPTQLRDKDIKLIICKADSQQLLPCREEQGPGSLSRRENPYWVIFGCIRKLNAFSVLLQHPKQPPLIYNFIILVPGLLFDRH